jgi:Leucine-rich repeat (LRR) protein
MAIFPDDISSKISEFTRFPVQELRQSDGRWQPSWVAQWFKDMPLDHPATTIKVKNTSMHFLGDSLLQRFHEWLTGRTGETGETGSTGVILDFTLKDVEIPIFQKWVRDNEMIAKFRVYLTLVGMTKSCEILDFPQLEKFIHNGPIKNLRIINCPSLTTIKCGSMDSLELHLCHNLRELTSMGGQIRGIDMREYPNLEILNLIGNNIVSFDSRGNEKLKELDISDNKLKMIHLGGLRNLKILKIHDNLLTEIDLHGLDNLREIDLRDNKIKKLDLHNKRKLRELWCSENMLSELSLDDCHFLEELSCEGNNIDELDLSGLHNLRTLSCHENKIKSLLLPSSPCNLQILYCYKNSLTEIDLGECHEIWMLVCHDNNLTILDLSSCQKLETFRHHGNPGLKIINYKPGRGQMLW